MTATAVPTAGRLARWLAVPLTLACPLWAQSAEATTTSLKYKAVPKWTVLLPQETWTPVGTGLGIAHAGGHQFTAEEDNTAQKLQLDSDGDGKFDAVIKGAGGYTVLQAKTPAGAPLQYAARFKLEGAVYRFASSGYLQGSLGGVAIRLIDQNNNGRFDEFGVDAMVVGNGNAASFLSRIVNLNGNLLELSFSDDGTELRAVPYTGPVGRINLAKGFAASGKLMAAVVQGDDRSISFELSNGVLTVPAGSYRIAGGQVAKANETVQIAVGRSEPIEVAANAEATLNWGGAVTAEFDFARQGGDISIQPTALKFYGRAGEEYLGFVPQGASPKFLVYDATGKKLLKTGRFGTC
jgi:hypothetical protein